MAKSKFSIVEIIVLFLFGLVIATACEETEEEMERVRLFRPVSAEIKSAGLWFSAEWDRIKGAVSYTAEISVDSFETSYASVEVDTNYVLFENLDELTTYYFRLRADADLSEYSSHWAYIGEVWIGKIPSILLPQVYAEATSTSIIVRWEQEDYVPTRLIVTKNSDGSVIQEVDLTGDDVNAEYKEITDLSPLTVYKVFIYSGDTSLGSELYMTKPS